MLRIEVKDGEKIDRAIKRYKRKFRNTKVLQELRSRKHYKKTSVKKREQLIKARYQEQYLLKKNK